MMKACRSDEHPPTRVQAYTADKEILASHEDDGAESSEMQSWSGHPQGARGMESRDGERSTTLFDFANSQSDFTLLLDRSPIVMLHPCAGRRRWLSGSQPE